MSVIEFLGTPLGIISVGVVFSIVRCTNVQLTYIIRPTRRLYIRDS